MSSFKSQFFNIMVERGFYNQCTNESGFDSYLYECEQKGTPAVGYLGSDPTGDSLHVGHIVPLMMLRWFQKCGHKPLTLVGGATATPRANTPLPSLIDINVQNPPKLHPQMEILFLSTYG